MTHAFNDGRNATERASIWSQLAAARDVPPMGSVDDAQRFVFNSVATATFARARLDAVVPGEWDVTFETLPSRFSHNVTGETSVKCRLQVLGVIREACASANTYRHAYRLAFLGACAMFGLPTDVVDGDDLVARKTDASFDVPAVPLGG